MLKRLGAHMKITAPCIKQFSTHKNEVTLEYIDNIAIIGINKPSKRNCLSSSTIEQLKSAFKSYDESCANVGILYGEGGNFCSGFDISEIVNSGYEPLVRAVEDWKGKLLTKKPLICALNGFAAAEGFELALACDLRVIEETACMGFHGRRFGVPSAFGGPERLASLVGHSRALDMILSGKSITGVMAHTWGLASRSVSTGTAFGQSMSLAYTVAKYPFEALQYDRLKILTLQHKNTPQSNDIYSVASDKLYRSAKKNILQHLPKFLAGVGRGGKTKDIIKKKLPNWEEEEDNFTKTSSNKENQTH